MDPTLSALLLSWEWRVDVIFVLVSLGTVYTLGWRRLRRSQRRPLPDRRPLAAPWRLTAYLGGLTLIGLALMSPIDILASQLFAMHMVQHIFLVMFAPPLLLIANPLPFLLWGLPLPARRAVTRLLREKSSFRQWLRFLTQPGFVWLASVISLLSWHDPNAYNATLRVKWIHDVEHLNFFGTAMLFWWPITRAGPRIHKGLSAIGRIVYLALTIPFTMLLGMAITFSMQPIYTYYTTVPRLWGVTVMQDQIIAGIIMWVPGSMMYMIAILVIVSQLLQAEEDKPPLPESEWATDEAMLAPGWEKQKRHRWGKRRV